MSEDRKQVFLQAGFLAAMAVLGGIVIRIIPVLQHWAFYVLWGPGVALGLAWIFSMTDEHDVERGRPSGERNWIDGLIVGVTHLVAVTLVWYAVTRGLVLRYDDGSRP